MTDDSSILASPALVMALADDLKRIQDGEAVAVQNALGDAPLLDHWQVCPYPAQCLAGTVHGHPLLGSRTFVTTSMLFAIDRGAGWARTLSRFYRLGAPLKGKAYHW